MDLSTSSDSPELCDRYYSKKLNRTEFFNLTNFEGIPENLIINVVCWLVLLVIFSFLRKLAWDYGRIALVSRNEERPIMKTESRYNVWTSLFYGDHDNPGTGSQMSLDSQIHKKDRGFCSWIPSFLRVRDDDIQRKCGRDAVLYLSFQRHLLVFMTILCVLSLAVVLPVNFQGYQATDSAHSFADTTVANLNNNPTLLWVHTILTIGYVAGAIYFMRLFSMNVKYDGDEEVTRTLMITNIKKDKCYNSVMRRHFTEAYPGVVIEDVQFAYNITNLMKLDSERQAAREGRINSELLYNKDGIRPMMVPYFCGILCCCCEPCGCDKVDAIQYYSEEEKRLIGEVEKAKATSYQKSVGIAFVTFQTDQMAMMIYQDMKHSLLHSTRLPRLSSLSVEIDSILWDATYAPSPDDIYWENLSLHATVWWIKAIFINAVVIISLFFLTTPSILMNLLDSFHYTQDLHSAFLVQFLPTVLLWSFTALLPYIVYYSDQLTGHWTRTSEHQAVMTKCFIFLTLMVVILPSLGLTSAKAFFEYLLSARGDTENIRWKCIFLPDNGAFFVNYIITSAFIGTALELIRFPELFMFIIRMMCARSAAERTAVRKKVLWEFQYGQNYAWLLCTFTVIVVYSVPCPLIVPFGLIYLALKHVIDRYNIYFAYAPSKIDRHIHSSAINYVMVALILLLFNVLFLLLLRSRFAMSITISVVLVFTLILFIGRLFFGLFKKHSHISYKRFENVDDDLDEEGGRLQEESEVSPQKPFVPTILKVDSDKVEENGASSAAATYGTVQVNVVPDDSDADEIDHEDTFRTH